MKTLKRLLAAACLSALAACASTGQDPDLTLNPAGGLAGPSEPVAVPVLSSAPLDTSATVTRIAFGSCADESEDQSIWTEIAATQPDVFLFMGDNVYGDAKPDEPGFNDPDLPKLRQSYADLGKSKPFEALRQSTPVLAVWDDHDYGVNDGGADYVHKQQAEALFEDVWDIPATDERRQRPGIYQSWMLGEEHGRRVQVILLDTRFFRSAFTPSDERGAPGKERYVPDPTAAKTMLGAEQWRWLSGELRKTADLRVIVSSIQVIADGHGWEAWKMLPSERERLYNMINAAGAENVVLLSGDRHAGAIYRKDLALTYPLYEVTSSSLNLPASIWREESGETYVEPGPNRLGGMVYDANFGIIDIDWEFEALSLELRGADGAIITREDVSLSDLRPVY
ncbi:alkaline phosphatase D family protein [Aquisalinus flavus]|uniref:PhoD-like phosphatase metallophosphatase domain-containing protein n=1 Tax=Aquisalinus flavus TaxID=1526572 RepID=A0A8J2Y6T6_9PROT|nr:alkaline phosphatase D family protein [Aquisalinus flavus]MBD0425669.1 alkaline phosphatase family protein [Aquisalinus flavus]GGD14206.1 hypothetical protein GCM10011342_23730 [Aquisalinus flavus]